MTIIEKTLEETKVLHGWDGLDVLPNVEEDPNDIWLLIEYNDHGDDFLVVGTKDGEFYKYGLFINRERHYWNGKLNGLREPELYKVINSRETADVSNKIFFELERALCKSHMSIGYDRKYYDEKFAQIVFNNILNFIQSVIGASDAVVDYNHRKDDILRWLELNEILTDENRTRLKETRFDNKIGEYKVVGVAGKEVTGSYIIGDYVKYIIVNNKSIDPDKVTTYGGSDEWGYESVALSLKGFRPSTK